MTDRLPIAVCISGSGSNLQALIDTPHASFEIVGVISDIADAYGLVRAQEAGIPFAVVRWKDHTDRDAFTRAVCDRADELGAQAVVLAGFMRILGPDAIARFPDALLNIHPSLLPQFPGTDAIGQALRSGASQTGVTVHVVDEQVDHGPIVAQEVVDVRPDDDAESLHARVQLAEHRLYPRVINAFARREFRVADGSVVWREDAEHDAYEETG